MTEPRAIMTVAARLRLRILAPDDVRRLHEAALRLLQGPDAAGDVTLQVTRPVVLTGRVPEHDLTLADDSCWLAVGNVLGPAATVRPIAGGDPRSCTIADLEDACRLADALPEVGLLAGPPLSSDDVDPVDALARCLAVTTKHVMATTLKTAQQAAAALRLADTVAIDERLGPLSLCTGPDGREAALAFARAGRPVALVLPVETQQHPADVATALVHNHAGVLAAHAAVQAESPGAPFLYLAAPSLAGLPATGPEAAMFQIAAAQLAAHVHLPVLAAGMLTGSHEPDWQACTQNSFAALSDTLVRSDITAGAGTLGGGSTFSLQQLVMDSEIYSWNAMIARGIPVNDETIAADAIKEVDIGGNFLSQRHTRRHMRDVWRPRLLDRSMWDAWVASGREGAYEKATIVVEQLLREHETIPLPDQVRATLERIVAEAGL